MILAKDFIETIEGLVFAVVENGLEQGKVLCFLRYIKAGDQWKKVNTTEANQFLADQYPHYLYYSTVKQAHCHAVVLEQVFKHHKAKDRVKQLLMSEDNDLIESDCAKLCLLFQKQGLNLDFMGVTGSILISAQGKNSDIDLVFYSRETFNQARDITRKLILQGECSEMSSADWLESYDRRQCDLSYQEYIRHEKRKFNKAIFQQRKFDLSFVDGFGSGQNDKLVSYTKIETIITQVQIIDDTLSFDYPAEFSISHPEIDSIVCYTATYTGQAKTGEWVEVAGWIEQSTEGCKRIVVGSNREACGEYIKVINV